jgi:hypothetical protein
MSDKPESHPEKNPAPALPKVEESPKLSISMDQLEAILTRVMATKNEGGGMTNDQFAETLRGVMGTQAEAFGRQLRPENVVHPGISAFSYPEGDTLRPKPILHDANGHPRETIFCGARQMENQLTPAEIDGFNAITSNCEARGGSWFARIKPSGKGKSEVLWVHVSCADIDDRMELPSLTGVLYELASGPKAVNLETLAAQLQDLKDQLARALAAAAPTPGQQVAAVK